MYENKSVHLIGIGGVSMSGIAEMLLSMGAKVSGSDVSESKITKHLQDLGIDIQIGHLPEMIVEKDLIVYSAAIHEDDPERQEAQKLQKPTFERAEFLGELMKAYKHCICISGTHGKSTTTGMISMIFLEAKLNPTIQIGAILPSIGSTSHIGSHDYLILEACEYVDSFLHFHPTAEVITNIDNDHLDYFKDLKHIQKSFQHYVHLLPYDGLLVVNQDDSHSIFLKDDFSGKVLTYGIQNDSQFLAKNITKNERGEYSFDVYKNHGYYLHIDLNIHGYHNVYNALAAIALASEYIQDKKIIQAGIQKYQGVERRFQYIGTYHQAYIYDDYAHHPTEILTTYRSSLEVSHHESWAVFEAHTYSRTKQHLDEFAEVLSGFDHILVANIYGAREVNTFGISENDLVNKIKEKNPNVLHLDSYDKIIDYLKDHVQKDDLILTIGAGPIYKVGYALKDLEN